jgi:hypothetical protein
MIVVSPGLIVVLSFLVILSGSLLAIFFQKPQTGKKIVEKIKVHSPYTYWPKDGGMNGLFLLMIFLLFLLSSCTLCFQLYGLV